MKKILILSAVLASSQWSLCAQTLQWVKQIGTDKIDRALSIAIDASGNTYTTGHFQDTVDLDPGPGIATAIATSSGEAFILKLDPAGNLLNAMTFGKAPSTHTTVGSTIRLDASGNIYTAGYYYGANTDFDPDTSTFKMSHIGSDNNAFVMKLDATGKFMWAKRWFYGKDDGITKEEGPAIAIDGAGNVYTVGRFKGNTDFDPDTGKLFLPGRGEDGYISKLDPAGNLVWAKHLATDTPSSNFIHPKSIAVDASGNMFVAGDFNGVGDFDPDATAVSNLATESQNGFLVKLDASGNFAWVKKFGTDASGVLEYHRGNAVATDAAGNAYITGSFMGTVAFGSISLTSAGNSDIYIAKLDGAGNFVWAKQLGSMYDAEEGTRIMVDESGDIYTAGTYRGTVDFNPGAGMYNMTTNGTLDVFVLKMTASGDFIWAKGYGGPTGGERIGAIAVKGNEVYTVGKFFQTVNFDPSGTNNLTAATTGSNNSDVFIHKMNQGATGIRDMSDGIEATIFPNPATSYLTIDITGTGVSAAVVSFFDMQGRKVLESSINRATSNVSVAGLAKGIYVVKIQSEVGYTAKKLVIE